MKISLEAVDETSHHFNRARVAVFLGLVFQLVLEIGRSRIDGSALRKLAEFVKAQGGDESYVYEPEKLPCAKIRKELLAPVDGYIQKIVCDEVGICSLILGGGRETKESQIDLSVGIRLIQKVGKYVHKGDVLAEVFANDCQKLEEAMTRLQQAYHIGPDEAKEQNVILDVVK